MKAEFKTLKVGDTFILEGVQWVKVSHQRAKPDSRAGPHSCLIFGPMQVDVVRRAHAHDSKPAK